MATCGYMSAWRPRRGRCSVVKAKLRHGIVLPIPCPQTSAANHRTGSNQSITQLKRVTFAVTPEVFSCSTTNRPIDGHANQRVEQTFNRSVFGWAGSSPEFGCSDRREGSCVGLTQFNPLRHDRGVARPRNFDKNVRIYEDRHRSANLSSLEPRRSCLTSARLSAPSR